MNERILELARQVWPDPSISHTNHLKFAELLIRECVGKCKFVADMATITNTGEMARKTKATADSCATMIKQHLGVSE